MTDQLVSFETAKLAKEKGLQFMLDIGGNCYVYNKYNISKQATSYHVHIQYPDKDKYLFAPTQSLLQKWLREKHDVHLELHSPNMFVRKWVCHFSYVNKTTKPRYTGIEANTYEEAIEQGLKEALLLIK